MRNAVVVIGAGSIGLAIARRISAGKHELLADLRQANADAAAENLGNAGFDVSTTTVDVATRAREHHQPRHHHHPLAKDELSGPRGEGYRRMIQNCPAGRACTPGEVGAVGALLMGQDGVFITGNWYGALAPWQQQAERHEPAAHEQVAVTHALRVKEATAANKEGPAKAPQNVKKSVPPVSPPAMPASARPGKTSPDDRLGTAAGGGDAASTCPHFLGDRVAHAAGRARAS